MMMRPRLRATQPIAALFGFVLILLGGVATAPAPAAASGQSSEEVAERLVLAGRQRMLAQAMASQLCLIHAGVEQTQNRNELYINWNVFSWYHSGLRHGNTELKLSREFSPKVQAAWNDLDTSWAELKEIYEPEMAGRTIPARRYLRAQTITDDVTAKAVALVAALRSVYSKDLGARGFGAALLLDLYERQRMFAEKITKDVCLIHRGDTGAERLANLTGTIELFNLSLGAFLQGRSDAGVPPPPSPEIETHLAAADGEWQKIFFSADAAAQGIRLERDELAEFTTGMDRFVSAMTAAINALVVIQR